MAEEAALPAVSAETEAPEPSGAAGAASAPETRGHPSEGPPPGWSRRGVAGTALLVAFFVAVGLFAAWTVTPAPDEEALARPTDADVVIAAGSPLSWDPAVIADGTSAQVLAQVYEGLTVPTRRCVRHWPSRGAWRTAAAGWCSSCATA
jgi:hypothetical protein